MEFRDFLQWAAGPGVGAIVALVLAWALEYVHKYDALAPKQKRLIFLGTCMVTPVIFTLLRVAVGHAVLSFDPLIWHALVAGAAAFGAGTVLHTQWLPTKEEAEAARDAIDEYRYYVKVNNAMIDEMYEREGLRRL